MKKLILREYLDDWARSVPAKGEFPELMHLLVNATSAPGTYIDFPAGSAVYMPDYDGIVKAPQASTYIPEGISLWELTTEKYSTSKANADYEKRKLDTLGQNPKDCVLVIVTLGTWKGREKFQTEKAAEGFWKDVRAYDARILEQWLVYSLPVSKWLAAKLLKHHDVNSILSAEESWNEWATASKIKLIPESVTSGRENESLKILEYINSPPSEILKVKAQSRDEAVAFAIASVMLSDEKNKKNFFSKALVVESLSDFRFVSGYQDPQIIIAKIDDIAKVHVAVSKGHHVIVPLGPDDHSSGDIDLPKIDKESLINSLIFVGLDEEKARKYVKESAGNITILKRLLGFYEGKLEWATPSIAKMLIPALFLGRWSERKAGDIEILEALSGEKYSDYIEKIAHWREVVFFQIGETWRLVSPMDAWTNLSPYISKEDLNHLKKAFLQVMQVENPALELPADKRNMASLFGKEPKFSTWCKEGLTQSLILVGVFGDNFKLPLLSGQIWVDHIVFELLGQADGKLWRSLNSQMQLISESSPNGFMDAVEKSLNSGNKAILEMFIEEESFITPSSSHTGLLWALEGLCWIPDFLGRAALLLAKLASLDPGGKLSNRPINSLKNIFKPWHYQTIASFEERMEVLQLIVREEKEIAWVLLPRLLPDSNDIGEYTHKLRWRLFNQNFKIGYTSKEFNDSHSRVIDLLISIFDYTEEKLSKLLRISTKEIITSNERKKILDFVESSYDKTEHKTYSVWNNLREILNRHRSYPDANWALDELELKKYEELYKETEPNDSIQKTIWMFNSNWPNFPEGFIYESRSTEQQQEIIDKRRIDALKNLSLQIGIAEIIRLGREVKEHWIYGDTLGYFIDKDDEIELVMNLLNDDTDSIRISNGFISRKSVLNENDWIYNWYYRLKNLGYSFEALAKFFLSINPSMEVWKFIANEKDVESVYWKIVNPFFYRLSMEEKIYGIEKLISFNRYITAASEIYHIKKEVPSNTIAEVLKKIATTETDEHTRLRGYEIDELISELDIRTDIEEQTLVNLEFLFLPLLAAYGSRRKPKLLHGELSRSPKFFIEILKLVYRPKDDELFKEERKGLTDEQIDNQGKRGYELLSSWKKVPGVDKDGSINKQSLENWVEEARKLAFAADRLEVADMKIGQILAHYPVKGKEWPEDILSIIEKINTDSIKRNFSAELFNIRGSSTRGPFDGGNIERTHAAYFNDLFLKFKNKFPNTATIFSKLSKSYELEAKQMDDQAERDKLDYL